MCICRKWKEVREKRQNGHGAKVKKIGRMKEWSMMIECTKRGGWVGVEKLQASAPIVTLNLRSNQ